MSNFRAFGLFLKRRLGVYQSGLLIISCLVNLCFLDSDWLVRSGGLSRRNFKFHYWRLAWQVWAAVAHWNFWIFIINNNFFPDCPKDANWNFRYSDTTRIKYEIYGFVAQSIELPGLSIRDQRALWFIEHMLWIKVSIWISTILILPFCPLGGQLCLLAILFWQ